MNLNFSEKYSDFFSSVCERLGNGWRVNKLDKDDHRIKIFSPNVKNFIVIARIENGRFKIGGTVESKINRYDWLQLTADTKKSAEKIASDIYNKIIIFSGAMVHKRNEDLRIHQEVKERDQLILNLVSSMAYTRDYPHMASTQFKHSNGVTGFIKKASTGYDVKIESLCEEDMIKLIAYLKTMGE